MHLSPEVLSGLGLNYAVALTQGVAVTIGKTNEGNDQVVLVDVAGVWRKFDPLCDEAMVSNIQKDFKIDCYQLGYGWSARQRGEQFSVHALCKEEAILRCFVRLSYPEVVSIPDSLAEQSTSACVS